MHNIKTNFDKILEVLKSISKNNVDKAGNFPKVGKKPKFSDLEIISLNLMSEYLSIDSEWNVIHSAPNLFTASLAHSAGSPSTSPTGELLDDGTARTGERWLRQVYSRGKRYESSSESR